MNIPLELRSVSTRLRIAYIVDAVNGGFPKCEPGNTLTRWFDDTPPARIRAVAGNPMFKSSNHPYSVMWRKIHDYYNANRWYELSDMELTDMWNTIRAVGIDDGDKHIDGVSVMDAKRRWDDNLWTRYECKRNGRRSIAYKIVPVGILAALGVSMPVPDVSV